MHTPASNPSSRPSSPEQPRVRGRMKQHFGGSSSQPPARRKRRGAVAVVRPRHAACDPLRLSPKSDGPQYATMAELTQVRPVKAPLPKRPQKDQPSPKKVVSGSRSFAPRRPYFPSPQPWRTPRRPNPDPHEVAIRQLEPQPQLEPEPEPKPEPVNEESQRHLLSAEELELVDALREEASDLLQGPAFARLRDDTTLHRFVCAREGDISQAVEMLRSRKRFHEEFGLDEVWAGWRPAEGQALSKRAEIGSKIFYAGLSGWTKEGGPLLVERLGNADLAGISREGEVVEDLALEAYVVYLETILRMDIRATREEQKYIRGLMVIDLSGLSWSTIANIGVVKKIAKTATANFAELCNKVFVVNAPWYAVKGWNLIRPLLPSATQAKVKILGDGDFLPMLDEYVDRDQLPDFLGGGGNERGGKDLGDMLGIPCAEKVPEGLAKELLKLKEDEDDRRRQDKASEVSNYENL